MKCRGASANELGGVSADGGWNRSVVGVLGDGAEMLVQHSWCQAALRCDAAHASTLPFTRSRIMSSAEGVEQGARSVLLRCCQGGDACTTGRLLAAGAPPNFLVPQAGRLSTRGRKTTVLSHQGKLGSSAPAAASRYLSRVDGHFIKRYQ